MMKEVLISIRPEWCELIVKGRKTVEVRKTKPKLIPPFKCYIYETKAIYKNYYGILFTGEGKVRGEFVCDNIFPVSYTMDGFADVVDCKTSCLSPKDFIAYGKGKTLYGWHISDIKIYDKPKELSEFKKINRECWYADLGLAKRDCSECKNESCYISRPPQSWCYVEGTVYCKDCKHLMFSDCYAECGKAYNGIVRRKRQKIY